LKRSPRLIGDLTCDLFFLARRVSSGLLKGFRVRRISLHLPIETRGLGRSLVASRNCHPGQRRKGSLCVVCASLRTHTPITILSRSCILVHAPNLTCSGDTVELLWKPEVRNSVELVPSFLRPSPCSIFGCVLVFIVVYMIYLCLFPVTTGSFCIRAVVHQFDCTY